MARVMTAMQLDAPGKGLRAISRAVPRPEAWELLIGIRACGVCRTDLHVVDGDLRGPRPIIPGHEIVGEILSLGAAVTGFRVGERVGVPWLGRTCGRCRYCRSGQENLCDDPVFTGFTRDGGFASHCVADSRYVFRLPATLSDVESAPLLCAGLIGYRSLTTAGDATTLGLYGFGAAAHIVAQVAAWRKQRLFAFTRPGDEAAQSFARSLGCEWARGSDESPPEPLDAAIIFASIGALVPMALKHVRKGGRVVCAGIHMSDIPSFPYADLWGERSIRSVANLTRADGNEFLALAARIPVKTTTTSFRLSEANEALLLARSGELEGAAVIVP